MIDKDLLAILACPDTRQPLSEADAALLARVNAEIAAGRARNVGGAPVTAPLESALVRQDRKVLYPIRDGIPILLMEEGLLIDEGLPL